MSDKKKIGRSVSDQTDLELMIQVQQGNIGAMGHLFDRHHARIYNFCHRMTGSREASEDLVQEVFMRSLKYRRSFRGDAEYLPWLYRLARNACNDFFKKSSRFPALVGDLPDTEGDEPSASEQLERQEQVCLLRQALLELPVDRREVLVLSRFEELPYEEIARLLGCTVGAVKVRVHRAMEQLRRTYLELLGEDQS